jgi:hypothetical protein
MRCYQVCESGRAATAAGCRSQYVSGPTITQQLFLQHSVARMLEPQQTLHALSRSGL